MHRGIGELQVFGRRAAPITTHCHCKLYDDVSLNESDEDWLADPDKETLNDSEDEDDESFDTNGGEWAGYQWDNRAQHFITLRV